MIILVTNSVHPDALDHLKNNTILLREMDKQSTQPQAIFTRSQTQVDESFLKQYPKVRYIATATSGLEHIDLEYCNNNNIEVFNPKKTNSISAAEHTWSLILALNKNILKNRIRKTQAWKNDLPRGHDLYKKSLGLIGLGEVGSRIAKVAHAFNMKVAAYDPYKDQQYFENHQTQKIQSLDELFKSSDIISMHTPLNKETRHLVNKEQLQVMKANAQLINTSRGSCLLESDLIARLNSNQQFKVALDVFYDEPLPLGHALIDHPQALLTRHVGAYTEEAFRVSSMECALWLEHKLQLC